MTTTLSSKYQIVIPRDVRESLKLKPGTKFEVVNYGKRVELIPVGPIKKMRGSLKGMDTTIARERDRV